METKNRHVYMDNAATTRLSDEAFAAMLPYMKDEYGNASSVYRFSHAPRAAIAEARQKVAAALGCEPAEIFFTSGGSESDNWAIKGAAALSKRGRHIVSSKIEHHAVLHTLQQLEKQGYEITLLDPDAEGFITPQSLADAIRPDTALVTLMAANNEIGTLQPVAEYGRICRENGVLFHTDAVQAVGHVPIDVRAMNIDLLSLSGHKFNGPKGVGALYVRRGVRLDTLVAGGGQEKGKRAGTENTPGIAGLGAAVELACAEMERESVRQSALRDRLIEGVLKIPHTRLTGPREARLPGVASFIIEYIEGEAMVLSLDLTGISASSGSACSTGSLDPSHVLTAIGLPHEVAHGSLRLSLGKYSTEAEVDYVLEKLPPIVERLRAMSPVWHRHEEK